MRLCPNCGQESPDEFKFCPSCATALPDTGAGVHEQRKMVTIVFSDVTGSTTLGESVDPESLRRMMSHYYDAMKTVLERHGGTVEKMIGDAVMGVFGIPMLHEDDALRAVRAAAEMRSTLAELNDELEAKWGVRIVTRTGVNTGQVLAAESMEEGFVTGGVTGDAVNVAARLEAAAEPGGILLGDVTFDLVRDAVSVEPVGPLDLKGKSEGVPAYRLLEVIPVGRAPARRAEAPMVGRERQLTQLRQAFEETIAHRTCHLFTVLGGAGVGKSRLVEEFLGKLGDVCTLLAGRCLSYGEGITFWPVAEVVRQAAGITDADTAEQGRAKIEKLVEGEKDAELIAGRVAALAGLAETSAAPEETFWAVRKLFEALARREPLVLIFDDIHWSEPGLLDLIDNLADWSRDAPILLICMARPELLDSRASWAGGKLNATTILLEPLTELECSALIHSLIGELDERAEKRFAEASDGNPLFLEEMIAVLIDDGVLRRDDGRWVAEGDLSEISVPPTISAVLAARLEKLPAEERGLVERASVIGKVFYADAVAYLTPEQQRAGIGEGLGALIRKHLIRHAQSEFAGREAYGFRHILTRDVAYDAIPKETRADLHERFAEWLERISGDRVVEFQEILGYHLEQAHRYLADLGPVDDRGRALAGRAAERLGAAGRRALARVDPPGATNLLSRAVALLPPDDALRLQFLPGLGRALVDLGDFERAERVLAEAAERSAASGDQSLQCHTNLARLELDSLVAPEGWADQAEEGALHAIEVFERTGDEQGLALAWGMLSDAHALRCSSAEASKAALEAIEHARRVGDYGGGFFSAYSISLFFGPSPVPEAIAKCAEILESWDIGRGPRAATLWALGGLRAMEGDFGKARSLVRESAAIDAELGREILAAMGPAEMLGRIEMLAGDPAAAERELRSGYDALKRMGERTYLSTVAAMLARAVESQGRLEEAEKLTHESEETAGGDDMASQVLWRSARARVLSRQGRHGEAERLAREAIDIVERTDYVDLQGDTYMDLAHVLGATGLVDDAIPAAQRASALCAKKGNVVSLAKAAKELGELKELAADAGGSTSS